MLTPEQLQTIPDKVSKLLFTAEAATLQDIARRLSKASKLTATAEYQLNRLMDTRRFETDYKKRLAELTKNTLETIDELYTEAAAQAYIYDKLLFDSQGIPFIPYKDNLYLQQLVSAISEQTKQTFLNLSQSEGFIGKGGVVLTPKEFYTEQLDNAITLLTTGVKDYDTVIKDSIKNMVRGVTVNGRRVGGGLRTANYASGHIDKVEVAMRRAILTGIKQLEQRISEDNAKKLNTTIFEISFHLGARISHGWGGLRYDTEGKAYPTAEQLFSMHGGGILGEWNCRHSQFPTFDFIAPVYSEEQLRILNQKDQETNSYRWKDKRGVEHSREFTYREALDRQRTMERQMRATRSEIAALKAADLPELANNAKGVYYAQIEEYKRFSKAMGIDTQFERVWVDGLGKLTGVNNQKGKPLSLNQQEQRNQRFEKNYKRDKLKSKELSDDKTLGVYEKVNKYVPLNLTSAKINKMDVELSRDAKFNLINNTNACSKKGYENLNDIKEYASILSVETGSPVSEEFRLMEGVYKITNLSEEASEYLKNAKKNSLILTHNHNNTSELSEDDLTTFLKYPSVKIITAAANGQLFYLEKVDEEVYDVNEVLDGLKELPKEFVKFFEKYKDKTFTMEQIEYIKFWHIQEFYKEKKLIFRRW